MDPLNEIALRELQQIDQPETDQTASKRLLGNIFKKK
jgi:hypothetical protein